MSGSMKKVVPIPRLILREPAKAEQKRETKATRLARGI
jgi:hypothetical protein